MKMMKVVIIGSGSVGTALARATKEAGHEVTVASSMHSSDGTSNVIYGGIPP